jgi:hypothetical protein
MDSGQIAMFYGCHRAGLAEKTFPRIGIVDISRMQQFDGDWPPKARVFRFVHRAHAACSQQTHDAVMQQRLAGSDCGTGFHD